MVRAAHPTLTTPQTQPRTIINPFWPSPATWSTWNGSGSKLSDLKFISHMEACRVVRGGEYPEPPRPEVEARGQQGQPPSSLAWTAVWGHWPVQLAAPPPLPSLLCPEGKRIGTDGTGARQAQQPQVPNRTVTHTALWVQGWQVPTDMERDQRGHGSSG